MRLHRFVTVLFCLLAGTTVGSDPATMYQLSRLSIPQLYNLLEDKDQDIRVQVVTSIGMRYEKPGVAVNGYYYKGSSPPLPVDKRLLDRLNNMAGGDPSLRVRIAALDALHRMKFKADTTPMIQEHLADKDVFVRLRSARILIQLSEDYHEGLSTNVIPTLIACLGPPNDTEAVWQAAWALGQLGAKAKEAIPDLEKARSYKSKKVRKYATDALAKIRANSGESGNREK